MVKITRIIVLRLALLSGAIYLIDCLLMFSNPLSIIYIVIDDELA